MRLIIPFLILVFINASSYGQQLDIGGVSVDYVWYKDESAIHGTKGVILLADSSYQSQLELIIANAIRRVSPASKPKITASYHVLPIFRISPKFKPVLKERDSDKQFMFFQIFDRLIFHNNSYDTATSHSIAVKYQVRSGKNDSVVDFKKL